MAKISTYPPVSSPTLSDLLIGTEVTNDNATVNFSISDILALGSGLYVPYTGANANVDLGTYTLSSGGADFFGPVYLDDALLDGAGTPGTAGQLLSSTVTGTQWIDVSSLLSDLQDVLDLGNSADQNITLTGANNSFLMSGSNASIIQQGLTSHFQQTGATAYIRQDGQYGYIQQLGSNAYIVQQGNLGYIQQQGANSYIEQIGINSYIEQTGANSYVSQTGANAYISQSGANSIIEQIGLNAFITQAGNNSFIQQLGSTAYIEQTGSNAYITQTGNAAYISQTGNAAVFSQQGTGGVIEQLGPNAYFKQFNPSAYIEPSQIKDGAASVGTAGQVLSSLGPNLGMEWISPLGGVSLGSFYDSTIQTTTVGVAVPMKFGTDDIVGYGVSVTADGLGNRTQIKVTEDGIYNIQFSAQIVNGAGASSVDIWFRKNGSNIANSNTIVSLQSNTNAVASWNFFANLVAADTFQIMWTQSSNGTTLSALPAAAPHPATPSVILTVNRVR